MDKRKITQITPHDIPWTLVFWRRRSRQNSNGFTPNWGAKYNTGGVQVKIGDFRQITCCKSKTSTVASVVKIVRSQVYHPERPPLLAERLPWLMQCVTWSIASSLHNCRVWQSFSMTSVPSFLWPALCLCDHLQRQPRAEGVALRLVLSAFRLQSETVRYTRRLGNIFTLQQWKSA